MPQEKESNSLVTKPEWRCTAETLQSWYTGSAAVAEITTVLGAMKYDPGNFGLGSSPPPSPKDDGFGGTPAEDNHPARLARTGGSGAHLF
ncbi:hypothetical protein E2C01_099608 [Portunus trituberculatus]|uniref:Uncharacterized protein n=1 Tax=Portunus trituberculatus TaxID=210409 RepID=A0A5B7KFD8_PORTR|nr:hypothetical protein [Portunus trituberculatus]